MSDEAQEEQNRRREQFTEAIVAVSAEYVKSESRSKASMPSVRAFSNERDEGGNVVSADSMRGPALLSPVGSPKAAAAAPAGSPPASSAKSPESRSEKRSASAKWTHPLMSDEHIARYRELFQEFDTDNGGTIDVEELNQMLRSVGQEMDPADLKEIIGEYDDDGSGEIDFEEFVQIFVKILGADDQGDSSDDEEPIVIGEDQLHGRPKMLKIPGNEFRFEEGIDWLKLRAHVDDTHPRELVDTDSDGGEADDDDEAEDPGKSRSPRQKMKIKFNCCLANIGQLGFGQAARQLTPAELEIGPGLTIYFRQVKLYMMVFLLFTIFSGPQFVILHKASQVSLAQEPGMVSRLTENHYLSYFKERHLFPLILPNLGYQDFYCQGVYLSELEENYSSGPPMLAPPLYNDDGFLVEAAKYGPAPENKTRMHVKCRRGNIENLLEVGLSTPGSRCPSTSLDDISRQEELLAVISTDPACSYRNSPADAEHAKAVLLHFYSIIGKTSNYFELNPNTMFSKECYDKILKLIEDQKKEPDSEWKPAIYILVQCLEDEFFNPITLKQDFTRLDLLNLVLTTDCAIVFCFMLSVVFLEKVSTRAILEFKDFNNKLVTRDFAIQVSNLPKVRDYKHQEILKAMLFRHFEDLVLKQPQQIPCLQPTQRYQNQIVDIFLAKQDYGPMAKLVDIKQLYQRIAYLDAYQKNTGASMNKKILKIEAKIDKLKERYITLQTKQLASGKKVEEMRRSINHSRSDNVQMAFVLFRSMEGKERALYAYRKTKKSFRSRLYGCLCCVCINCCCYRQAKQESSESRRLKFMEKHAIVVEPASDPEHILWNNFKVSCCRSCCSGFLTLLTSFFMVSLMLAFLWYKRTVVEQFREAYPEYLLQQIKPSNDSRIITAEQALSDYYKKPKETGKDSQSTERIGLMMAYCEHETLVRGRDPAGITFPGSEAIKHCLEIQKSQDFIELLEQAQCLLIAILIPLTMWVFKSISWCQSTRTTQERYQFVLRTSLIVSFINTVVLTVLGSYESGLLDLDWHFNLEEVASWLRIEKLEYDANFLKPYLPILRGDFTDTTVGWHFEIGLSILASMLLFLVLSLLLRCCRHCCLRPLKMRLDRCCGGSWVQTHGTRRRTQHDLNEFYSGEEFNISQSYSLVHLVTWVCLTFSSTMPAFYPLGFLFFFAKYWFDKYLVLNYHRKPTTYNEQLSFNQIQFFKVGIFLHILYSIVNLSNNQIFYDAKIKPSDIGFSQNLAQDLAQNETRPTDPAIPSLAPALAPRDLTLIPEPQTLQTRFLSLHMILLYVFYFLTFLAYVLQEKIESCLASFCARCRGEGRKKKDEESSSSEDEDELRKGCGRPEDADCAVCKQRREEEKAKRKAKKKGQEGSGRKEQVKQEPPRIGEKRKRYLDSSDEELDVVGGAGDDKDEAADVQEAQEECRPLSHYSDDFFREVSVDYLFFYYDLNNLQLQQAIQALTQTVYWNPHYGHRRAAKYVGETYRQIHMKQMIGLFKRRRKTFQRRFIQIMKKMNPRINLYLTFGAMGGDGGTTIQDLFQEQLAILRRIMLKKDFMYDKSAADQKVPALSLDSWRQKQILHQVNCNGRIQQLVQSYDVADQPTWQGTMAILKMYLPLLKSSEVRHSVVTNAKKNDELRLTDTMSEYDEPDYEALRAGHLPPKDGDAHFDFAEEMVSESLSRESKERELRGLGVERDRYGLADSQDALQLDQEEDEQAGLSLALNLGEGSEMVVEDAMRQVPPIECELPPIRLPALCGAPIAELITEEQGDSPEQPVTIPEPEQLESSPREQ